MTPLAVQVTGYHPEHGLLFTIALSLEGVAGLLTGKALAFDLREQGLPRGHVVVVAAADPQAAVAKLGEGGFDGLLTAAPDRERRTLRCPDCSYTQALPAAVVDDPWPVCPNDRRALVAV